jgi:RNA polymerase sigma-70 factor (ECF subfamily)
LTDQSIITSILNPATLEQGFQELLDMYQERLYWHIRRIVHVHEDADDVLQNVWVKVYRNIRKFDQKSSLYTWLYRIATNEALTHKSKRKLATNTLEGSVAHLLQSDPYFEGNEAMIQLKIAIDSLPEKQMLVFNMKYYQEMKYSEISEILGTSVGGLKASYHHAVTKIKASITSNIL